MVTMVKSEMANCSSCYFFFVAVVSHLKSKHILQLTKSSCVGILRTKVDTVKVVDSF